MTVALTVIIEGFLISLYALVTGRSWPSLLVTSIAMNLLTQTFLLVVLNVFYWLYLPVLAIAELLIWIIEAAILLRVASNGINLIQALGLSFALNFSSFLIGLLLLY